MDGHENMINREDLLAITGDSISFVVETQRGKQTYTGALAGDEIKFKREAAQGPAREFVAKRAK